MEYEKICIICKHYVEKSQFPSSGKCWEPIGKQKRGHTDSVDWCYSCEKWELQDNETLLKMGLEDIPKQWQGDRDEVKSKEDEGR